MKKFLWVATFAVAAVACSDKEDNVSVNGVWALTSDVASGCTDSDDNSSNVDENGCTDGNCSKYTFADGTITMQVLENEQVAEEFSTEYKINGSTMNIMGQKITVKRSGNILTISSKDTDTGCTYTTTLELMQ